MATVPQQGRVLRRSQSDRILGGVCGGLARYFDTDPLLVRLIFIVIALAQGLGVLLYLALWVFVPEEGADARPAGGQALKAGIEGVQHDVTRVAEEARTNTPAAHRQTAWLGALLLIVGGYLLAFNLGLFWWWDWKLGGPVLLILLGLLLLIRRLR